MTPLSALTKSTSPSSPRDVSGRTAIALTGNVKGAFPDWPGDVTCGGVTIGVISFFPLGSLYSRETRYAIWFSRADVLPVGCQDDQGGAGGGLSRPARTMNDPTATPTTAASAI